MEYFDYIFRKMIWGHAMRFILLLFVACAVISTSQIYSYMRLSLSPGLEPYGDALGYNIALSYTMDLQTFIKPLGPGWFAGLDISFASAGYSNLTFYHMNGGVDFGYRFPVINNTLNISPYMTLGAGYYNFVDSATNLDRIGFLIKPSAQIEYMIAPQFSVSFDFGARFVLTPLLTNMYCLSAYILSLNISYYFQTTGEQTQFYGEKQKFVKDLENIIRDEKIKGTVSQDAGNEINLNLPDVLFDAGKDSIHKEYTNAIKSIAIKIKRYRNLKVSVEGHTDNLGDDIYNSILSTKRARNVSDLFIKFGVARSQISFKGWGKNKPIAPNTSEINRAKNRRVEIKFIW